MPNARLRLPFLVTLVASGACAAPSSGGDTVAVASQESSLTDGPRLVLKTLRQDAVRKLTQPEKDVVTGLLAGGREGDFDGDGETDTLTTTGSGFTVTYASGKKLSMTVPDREMVVQGVEPIGLGPRNVTSFLVATMKNDEASWYSRKPQLLVRVVDGKLVTTVLSHIDIIGRDVTCTKVPTDWDVGLCMFASYGKDGRTYSTLVEVEANGKVVDVTRDRGLPWLGAGGTSVSDAKYVNGKYMMGFAWVDLNGDGLPDLVGGGQHSQLFSALMVKSGGSYAFTSVSWFDQADEYVAVSSLRKSHYAFPCVYVGVEREGVGTARGDYVTCYSKASKSWTKQALPAKTTTGETITRYELNQTNSEMADVGRSIFLTTRGYLSNGTVEVLAIRAVEAEDQPAIVPPTMRSEVFDARYYLQIHSDLRDTYGTSVERAAVHWQTWGIDEGRRASPTFGSKAYLDRYPDVKARYGAKGYEGAINHYIAHGLEEGRSGL